MDRGDVFGRRNGVQIPSDEDTGLRGLPLISEMKSVPDSPKYPQRLRVVVLWVSEADDEFVPKNRLLAYQNLLEVALVLASGKQLSGSMDELLSGFSSKLVLFRLGVEFQSCQMSISADED